MRNFLYLSLFVVLCIYSWSQVYDGDIGHHLRAGQWMVAHGQILARDIFSYTAYGNHWLNHSWLAQIILYYIYSLSGINGLIFFKIIILFLSYALLLKACHAVIDKRDLWYDTIIAILFIMSVNSASSRFMVRPLIFTFLGVSLYIYLFAKARKNINVLFFMPLVLMLWVNLHAEFMLGVIMIAIFWLYTAGSFLIKKFFKKGQGYTYDYFLKATIILLLSAGVLFLNPYSAELLVHPVTLTTSDLFMARISEWLPPMHPLFREQNSIIYFYWFLGIGILSFLLNFKKRDLLFFFFFIITFGLVGIFVKWFKPYMTVIDIGIIGLLFILFSFLLVFKKRDIIFYLFFIIFGLMSLSAIRFMPYLTMIGIPIVSENLYHLFTPLRSRICRGGGSPEGEDKTRGNLLKCQGYLLQRLAVIGVIIWSIFLIEDRTRHTEFGLGFAKRICYPFEAGEFLNRAGLKGNIFNMCDFGGYLIWFHPERPVFVDGRLDVYGEKLYEDFLSPAEDTFKKYDINYIFLSFRHPVTRGLLYQNKSWPLIYWDDTALVYVKRSKENMELIERFAYQYIHPLTGSYNFLEHASPKLKACVWEEIHRAIRISPASIRAHVVLGDIYIELKDYPKAIQAYEQAIQLGKKYNTAYLVKIYHNVGRLYDNLREYPKAEWYYRRVIKMARPQDSAFSHALEDWAHLAYTQKKKRQAFSLIKKAVKYKARSMPSITSDYPITLAKLAILYEEFGKREKAIAAWQKVYEIGGRDCRQQAYEHLGKLKIKND